VTERFTSDPKNLKAIAISRFKNANKPIQPFTIAVFGGMLKSDFSNEKPITWEYSNHAVTAIGIGRDPKTKKCGLFLKNHWGKDCKAYSPRWPCHEGIQLVDFESLSASGTHEATFFR
jgi:hypothetical protein